ADPAAGSGAAARVGAHAAPNDSQTRAAGLQSRRPMASARKPVDRLDRAPPTARRGAEERQETQTAISRFQPAMWKLDRILLQTTAAFLRRLRQRLLIIILIAVVPILGLILFQAKIARDTRIDEARETAWQVVENVALRESRFIDAAEQLLALLAETPDV